MILIICYGEKRCKNVFILNIFCKYHNTSPITSSLLIKSNHQKNPYHKGGYTPNLESKEKNKDFSVIEG